MDRYLGECQALSITRSILDYYENAGIIQRQGMFLSLPLFIFCSFTDLNNEKAQEALPLTLICKFTSFVKALNNGPHFAKLKHFLSKDGGTGIKGCESVNCEKPQDLGKLILESGCAIAFDLYLAMSNILLFFNICQYLFLWQPFFI